MKKLTYTIIVVISLVLIGIGLFFTFNTTDDKTRYEFKASINDEVIFDNSNVVNAYYQYQECYSTICSYYLFIEIDSISSDNLYNLIQPLDLSNEEIYFYFNNTELTHLSLSNELKKQRLKILSIPISKEGSNQDIIQQELVSELNSIVESLS